MSAGRCTQTGQSGCFSTSFSRNTSLAHLHAVYPIDPSVGGGVDAMEVSARGVPGAKLPMPAEDT